MIKEYVINLPIFKVGDDLGYELNRCGKTDESFAAMTARYEYSANAYRALNKAAKLHPEIKISAADTHMILIEGPEEYMEPLVKEGFICEWEIENDEDDENE